MRGPSPGAWPNQLKHCPPILILPTPPPSFLPHTPPSLLTPTPQSSHPARPLLFTRLLPPPSVGTRMDLVAMVTPIRPGGTAGRRWRCGNRAGEGRELADKGDHCWGRLSPPDGTKRWGAEARVWDLYLLHSLPRSSVTPRAVDSNTITGISDFTQSAFIL